MVGTIITYLLCGYVLYSIGTTLYKKRYELDFIKTIYFRQGFMPYLLGFATVFLVLALCPIYYIVPKFLQWGWYSLISSDGMANNFIVAPFEQTAMLSQFWKGFVLFIIWSIFILVLPFLAKAEEESFRKDRIEWLEIIIASFIFGIIHLIMGIPIIIGLILFVPGFLFACRYRYIYFKWMKKNHGIMTPYYENKALEAVIAYHTIYNVILITSFSISCFLFL